MKKIAIISFGGLPLPAVKGGAVENLIQFFVENNEKEKNAELTVFSSYDSKAEIEASKYQNTKFVYIKRHGVIDPIVNFTNRVFKKLRFSSIFQIFPYLIDIVKIIKKSDFDCVVVENRAEYVPYLKRKINIPIFLHMHNDYLDSKYYLANSVVKGCTKIIAVSDYIKNCVLTIENSRNHVSVLRNVIDTKAFMNVLPDVRCRLREEYNIKQDDVVFAFVGRLTPDKGIEELIDAFSSVAQKHTNVKLLVVGAEWFSDSSEGDYLKKLRSKSIGIEDKIIFTGYVDYLRISEQYACADVVVVPSIIGEACGLVVLEAMASAKALIVSDSGGIPEHIDSKCAIVVPRKEKFAKGLSEAMEKLISDRMLLESMGEHGRCRASNYDKENYLARLLEQIES